MNILIIVLAPLLSMLLFEVGMAIAPPWVGPAAGQTMGLVVGVAAAVRYRAVIALLVIGTLAADTLASFIVHFWMGIRAAQGLDVHIVAMLAGLFGIACALAFRRREPVGTPIE